MTKVGDHRSLWRVSRDARVEDTWRQVPCAMVVVEWVQVVVSEILVDGCYATSINGTRRYRYEMSAEGMNLHFNWYRLNVNGEPMTDGEWRDSCQDYNAHTRAIRPEPDLNHIGREYYYFKGREIVRAVPLGAVICPEHDMAYYEGQECLECLADKRKEDQ